MKIAIVGAGWYGCHLCRVLTSLGSQCTLFDKEASLFNHASAFNQNRLHQGFHYPRNHKTRLQTVSGFEEFMKSYGALTDKPVSNLYAVPLTESLLDFQTYYSIMISAGLVFERSNEFTHLLCNTEGIIDTSERIINLFKVRSYFEELLKGSFKGGSLIDASSLNSCSPRIHGVEYDYLIDCTWGHLLPSEKTFFEPALLLVMSSNCSDLPAVTFVDGEFPSIYPTSAANRWTLSHVKYTPLGKYSSPCKAKNRIKTISNDEILARSSQMIKSIQSYYPGFSDYYQFNEPQLSIKTKPYGLSADRSCDIIKNDRIITVRSGKIDTIFVAANNIIREITL